MRGLRDKRVLISGGSSGVGLATAERFLEEGSRVFVCGVDADEVAAAIAGLASCGEISGLACDVSAKPDVTRMIGEAARALGGVDVLVNNAGIARRDPFLAIAPADWDRILEVNLRGMFLVAQAVSRHLVERGDGSALVIDGGQLAVMWSQVRPARPPARHGGALKWHLQRFEMALHGHESRLAILAAMSRGELAVVMVAVFGTMAADVLHIGLGIPYAVSTMFFMIVLAVIFVAWYRSEGTLSIHSIYTRRRELFYWATVPATFALGTAAGNLTAKVVGLGYFGSGVMFAVVIAVPAVAYRWLGLNAIVAFWFAYIVTRPLGASFADWLAWPPSLGGLGLGHGVVSLGSTVIIVGLVAYMAVSGKDVMVRHAAPGPADRAAAEPGHDVRGRPVHSPLPGTAVRKNLATGRRPFQTEPFSPPAPATLTARASVVVYQRGEDATVLTWVTNFSAITPRTPIQITRI